MNFYLIYHSKLILTKNYLHVERLELFQEKKGDFRNYFNNTLESDLILYIYDGWFYSRQLADYDLHDRGETT